MPAVQALRRTAATRGWRWMAAQALITLAAAAVAAAAMAPVLRWALESAAWGAVAANGKLFAVGIYPSDQLWRPEAALVVVAGLMGLTAAGGGIVARDLARLLAAALVVMLGLPLVAMAGSPGGATGAAGLVQLAGAFSGARGGAAAALAAMIVGRGIGLRLGRTATEQTRRRWERRLAILWLITPLALLGLIRGTGAFTLPAAPSALVHVSPHAWGGLLLTLVLSVVAIAASFPLGVLLALGRRSPLPLVKVASVIYIEVIRGVPLVTVLFMAQNMAPLILPEGPWLDRVFRAMVGFTMFASAYVAEDVRGGLAAVGRGQYEAAHALGLGTAATYRLVVLPQAIRTVIPAMVGQFISLFKDTSLVAIVGLKELLGIALVVVAQPEWLGRFRETLVF
ncbi:MAG: amino acid ABC transporter permease, partial [Anaerolineae bacterium]